MNVHICIENKIVLKCWKYTFRWHTHPTHLLENICTCCETQNVLIFFLYQFCIFQMKLCARAAGREAVPTCTLTPLPPPSPKRYRWRSFMSMTYDAVHLIFHECVENTMPGNIFPLLPLHRENASPHAKRKIFMNNFAYARKYWMRKNEEGEKNHTHRNVSLTGMPKHTRDDNERIYI